MAAVMVPQPMKTRSRVARNSADRTRSVAFRLALTTAICIHVAYLNFQFENIQSQQWQPAKAELIVPVAGARQIKMSLFFTIDGAGRVVGCWACLVTAR